MVSAIKTLCGKRIPFEDYLCVGETTVIPSIGNRGWCVLIAFYRPVDEVALYHALICIARDCGCDLVDFFTPLYGQGVIGFLQCCSERLMLKDEGAYLRVRGMLTSVVDAIQTCKIRAKDRLDSCEAVFITGVGVDENPGSRQELLRHALDQQERTVQGAWSRLIVEQLALEELRVQVAGGQ
jgi:hypothetical protein